MTKSIGGILKQKRIERNLTLDEVSKALYIRINYLEALENNNFEVLPSPVQARGFVHLYADFLNIDDINGVLNPPQVDTISEEIIDSEHLPKLPAQDKSTPSIDENEIEIPPHEESLSADIMDSETDLHDQNNVEKTTSQDIFKTIGNILLTQREALGITLEEVERHTHLKMHYLKFLEGGKFDSLPSPVQGKGMLSNYARFLDLDAEQILLLFADALQTKREELNLSIYTSDQAPSSNKRMPTKPSSLRRFITPDLLIGSSIIGLIFVFSLWTISTINTQRDLVLEATPPPISDVLSNQSLLNSTTTPNAQITPTPGTTQQNLGNAQNIQEGNIIQEGTIPTKDDKPLQVYLITSDRAWVRVIADTKTVFNGRVQSGNAYPFSADTQIELVTGNAAALQVFFNQKDLGTLGIFGEISSLVFTNQGVLTPTPIFTPTYTPTIPPTLTPFPTPTIPSPTVTPFIP